MLLFTISLNLERKVGTCTTHVKRAQCFTGDGVNGRGVSDLRNSHIWRTRGERRRHHPDSVIQSEHEELTHTTSNVVARSSPSSYNPSGVARSETIFSSVMVDLPEEFSGVFYIIRGPELLEHAKSAQCLRSRLFEHMLSIPKSSLQPRRASQKICVIDRVQLGLFNMSMCVVEPSFPGK